MGMAITTRARFGNVRQAVRDQSSDLVMSTDGTYKIHIGQREICVSTSPPKLGGEGPGDAPGHHTQVIHPSCHV